MVHTYGNERLEQKNYAKYLSRSNAVQARMTRNAALGITIMFFFIFTFYSYSFYFGSLLRDRRVMNGKVLYTGGSILSTMFCVIFGSFGLGGAAPHLKSVAEGRIAGKLAFDTIDQVPLVKGDEENALKLKAGDIRGHIEFKDVSFSYPSRPEL